MSKSTDRNLKAILDVLPANEDIHAAGPNAAISELADELSHRSITADAFESTPFTLTPASTAELERQKEILQATAIGERRELGKISFDYFIKNCVFPTLWRLHYGTPFHQHLIDEVEGLKPGHDLWFFVPREHRKSYILTVLHSLWLIINDPDIRILIVGARKETIAGLIGLIQSAFTKGAPGFEFFQQVYPEYIHDKKPGGAFAFKHKLRTLPLADPTVRGTYLGVAGASWRCDVLKYDDPIERRHVRRPELAMTASRDMLDLLPLLATGSKYKMITGAGTRWAYFDPYSYIIGEEHDESDAETRELAQRELGERKIRVIVRHGFEDPDTPCEHCPAHIQEMYPHGNPDMEKGVPLAEPVITRQHLEDRHGQYLLHPDLGEALYWHQYMNVCKSPSTQKFQDEWFTYILERATFPSVRKRVLCIDSADKDFQKEGQGDFMVALMGDFSDEGRLCLRHGIRSNKWTRKVFLEHIIAWCQATGWWPAVVVKEKVSNDTFLSDVQREFNAHFHPVHTATLIRPMILRKHDLIVEALQSPFEAGEIVWGNTCPKTIINRASYELCNLGQTKYDDVADTLVLFYTQGVRIRKPARAIEQRPHATVPDLSTYLPKPTRDRIPEVNSEPPVVTPMEIAATGQRVASAIVELGPLQVSFTPEIGGPELPNLLYDPRGTPKKGGR